MLENEVQQYTVVRVFLSGEAMYASESKVPHAILAIARLHYSPSRAPSALCCLSFAVRQIVGGADFSTIDRGCRGGGILSFLSSLQPSPTVGVRVAAVKVAQTSINSPERMELALKTKIARFHCILIICSRSWQSITNRYEKIHH